MDLGGGLGERPAGGVGEAALGVGLEKGEREDGGGRGPSGVSSLLSLHCM